MAQTPPRFVRAVRAYVAGANLFVCDLDGTFYTLPHRRHSMPEGILSLIVEQRKMS